MTIDVWTYRIRGGERCEEWVGLLSPGERERYERFHFDRHRREFACAHALLRRALSRAAGGLPERWEFGVGSWGKPYLTGDGARLQGSKLEFNLSHTNGFVACAIATGVEVGVDVERVDRAIDAGMIARRFFADAEAQYIESLPEGVKREAFFRIWTMKEAYVKACGRGFDLPLRDFWFALDEGAVRVTSACKAAGESAGEWRFWEFEPAEGYRMAVAALGNAGEMEIRLFEGGELL